MIAEGGFEAEGLVGFGGEELDGVGEGVDVGDFSDFELLDDPVGEGVDHLDSAVVDGEEVLLGELHLELFVEGG